MKDAIVQNTPEWHDWRAEGIGGSDANRIWNGSEADVERLIFEKSGLIEPEEISEYAANMGHGLEPVIRERAESELRFTMPAKCVQHPVIKWMRASLDGWNSNGVILEAKAVGSDMHVQVSMGIMPDKHLGQVLHNVFVSGAERCLYSVFNVNTRECASLDIRPGRYEEETARLIMAEHAIWEAVHNVRQEYNLSGHDEVEDRYVAAKRLESIAKKAIKDTRDQLMGVIGDRKLGSIGRVKFRQVETKGRLDSSLMLASGVNPEDFRGDPTLSYRLTIGKE